MSKIYVFNNAIETGLRSLIILDSVYPKLIDLNKIMYYDYLMIHSGDVKDGPPSIHPATPNRTGEILVKRKIVEEGIILFIKKGLIEKVFTSHGIDYRVSDNASVFLDILEEKYTTKLKDRASWVISEFSEYSNEKLHNYMKNNLDKWGGEFIYYDIGEVK